MRILLSMLLLIPFFTGCAVFQSSKKINMEPFSDNAGILFTEAVKVSRPFQFKNLKIYTDIPEYTAIKERAKPLLTAMKGIVYYSHQIVVINNSKIKDKEKNLQLARYLNEVFEKARHKAPQDSIRLYEKDINRILDDIRGAKTYREGIHAASPMINSIVLALLDRLDEIEAGVTELIGVFENQIDQEFAAPLDNYLRLKHLQTSTQYTLSQLYLAMSEDRAILDTLLQKDNYLSNYIKSSKSVTRAQFENAEAYLSNRLRQVDEMFKQLADDVQEYISQKDELSNWQLQVDEKLSIARNAITVWAQSHRNLGDGIPVPPLIDIATIAGSVIGAASSAVK